MATENQTLELTRDDINALLDILRKSSRPMSIDELAEALKNAASNA